MSLKDKIIVITGASRGIGREIALKCAKDGAKIAILSKSTSPNADLPGTVYSVAAEVEALGGTALPIPVDVRDEEQITGAIAHITTQFGGIDVLINNASALFLGSSQETPMKRFDLIFSVNVRATFLCSTLCIPWLKLSENPHILNISPPINLRPKWFKNHLAYTMSKYGMSMCTLGMAEELKSNGIAVNSLWPQTIIATSAIEKHFPSALYQATRSPAIMADACYQLIQKDSNTVTGHFFTDEELLQEAGITNFDSYSTNSAVSPYTDLFLD